MFLQRVLFFAHQCNLIEDIQRNSSSNITLWIWGTKIDKSDERAVSTEEGYLIASKYDAIFFETSAKEATNINLLFEILAVKIKEKKELDTLW